MNIVCQVSDLVRELELLVKVVAAKPTIPVLANVLVQAEGNGLRLAATDLEIGLVTFCPATVNEPGVTTLPAKHLLDVLRLLSGEVTLTFDKTSVRLTSSGYQSRLQTFSAADYPAMPSMKDLPTVTLTGLQDAIRQVHFAVSDKNKRYFMDGALLSFTEAGYTLAATDSHRLAYSQVTSATWEATPLIIPSKTLDKLMEIPGEMLVAVGARHLFFVIDGRMLFSRMVDGKFPDYSRIIPREHDRQASIPRLAFQTAMKRLVLTSPEVVCRFTTDTLTIASRSVEVGDASEPLAVQYEGPEAVVTLNGEYLLEFLAVATGGAVTLVWKNAGALLFTDGDAYAYVQMPLRNA